MTPVAYTWIESPLGRVAVAWSDRGLERVGIGHGAERAMDRGWRLDPSLDCEATRQVRSYLHGELRAFDLPVVLAGNHFLMAVWRELRRIPYGDTLSYGALAARVGDGASARAVGLACNRNPVPIVVPCHRVIGADGRLVGFGGGLPLKRGLLELERRVSGAGQQPLFAPGYPELQQERWQ
jgi:methylated-DNA-[protein]-cysteine S-methyltransferase